MRALDPLGAIAVTMLPSRYWPRYDWLPLHIMAPVSGALTAMVGTVLGILGYFAYLEQLRGLPAISILDVARRQVTGELPETAAVSAVPAMLYMTAPIAFALFSPLGVFSLYLLVSGWVRVVSWWVAQPHGDPLLTFGDWLFRRTRDSRRDQSVRRTRLEAEGAEEPDRRYKGGWAGLTDVDFVIVAARRKPDWRKGTFVITPDGWFTLGEPFDRPTPNGLRTVYPLTAQTDNAVLRKGVSYELPPLRRSPGES